VTVYRRGKENEWHTWVTVVVVGAGATTNPGKTPRKRGKITEIEAEA